MKYLPADLEDHIEELAQIICDKCGALDDCYVRKDINDLFFSRGWRATFHHCYCPQCARKHLKLPADGA